VAAALPTSSSRNRRCIHPAILWNPHRLIVRSQVACDRRGAGRLGSHCAHPSRVVRTDAWLEAFPIAHRVRTHRGPRASVGVRHSIEHLERASHGSGPRCSVDLTRDSDIGIPNKPADCRRERTLVPVGQVSLKILGPRSFARAGPLRGRRDLRPLGDAGPDRSLGELPILIQAEEPQG
jgi:hypothetical protein